MEGSLTGFPEGFEKARAMIDAGECSVALFRGGAVQRTASGRGIGPLLGIRDEAPEALCGAAAADRIIGRAAAMIMVLSGVTAAYAAVMSEAGRDMLSSHGVAWACGTLAPYIVNREGTGMCPIEQSVADERDPAEGLVKIRRRVAELKKANA